MQMTREGPARPFWRSRLWMPAFSLGLGLLMLAAFAAGGSVRDGLAAFAVMAALAALFWFGRRSETLQGLGGPGRDERWETIDVTATAITGTVLITVVLGAWLFEIASGRDGSPYGQLAAVAGVVYLIAIAVLRRRS